MFYLGQRKSRSVNFKNNPQFTVSMTKFLHNDSILLLSRLSGEPSVYSPLERLRQHHEQSYDHSLRVGLLSIDLGYDIPLDEDELKLVGYCGLLHDIGKTQIPIEILAKTGTLTDRERKLVEGHSRLGYLEVENFQDVPQILVRHHEFKRTKPYPRTGTDRRLAERSGEERREPSGDTLAQIVAIADLYDALASQRSYKDALTPDKVEEILRYEFMGEQRFIDRVLVRAHL